MEPLQTVHVSSERGWHGGEEQIRLLARELRERGHEAIMLARRGGALAARLAEEGFQVRTFSASGRSPWAMWQTRAWLRRIRPDVIHFHDSHALSGGGLAAWGLPIGAKVVSRRVAFPIRSSRKYRAFSDRVIAVSAGVADVCRDSGIPAERLRVVHDGVDPGRAESGDRDRGRQSLGLADDQVLLLTVATLTDTKGHTYLLKALPSVLDKHPNVVLALAGDGELRDKLAAEAVQLGIAHAVRFLGYRQDVPDLLKAADLFVLPSHFEGLCSSLIDAMFARLPIVTTTAGGIPDVVGNSGEGEGPVALTVPPRDPAALASAIRHALANRAQLSVLIDRAKARAKSLFTADQMVEGTLEVYREILSASSLPPSARLVPTPSGFRLPP